MELPLPSMELPLPSMEQSLPSVEQPLPSVEQPLPSVEQPLPSMEQSLPSMEQPLPSVGLVVSAATPNCGASDIPGIDYKTTTILLDGRRVKLELCGAVPGCAAFESAPKIGVAPTCVSEANLKLEQLDWIVNVAVTVGNTFSKAWVDPSPESCLAEMLWGFLASFSFFLVSTGLTGILLVYDITNRWSFDGIDRWIKEIDEHAPGVPRILVGNRLHLAFKRQVPTEQARAYAEKNCMTFFEVSPLCNFNVIESFTELSRIVLMRHGMEKIWRPNRVFSLQDLCCRAIVSCTPVHLIDKLPLPVTIKSHLKSFSMANGMNAVMMHGRSYSLASSGGGSSSKGNSLKRSKSIRPPQSPPQNCSRNNCKIS
ncbi:hypothetical protein WISP_88973 [Willisornis vidua]|uniref:small monomeric GTPase n=1 Tax=Willisornis vidua TaxID=1566151 RepID=A0ABQ9D6M8_9PASS|nr:hypothetical protein WISP_88973 [Willisornis vidua]